MAENVEINVEIKSDFESLLSQLEDINQSIITINSNINDFQESINNFSDASIKNISEAVDDLKKQIDRVEQDPIEVDLQRKSGPEADRDRKPLSGAPDAPDVDIPDFDFEELSGATSALDAFAVLQNTAIQNQTNINSEIDGQNTKLLKSLALEKDRVEVQGRIAKAETELKRLKDRALESQRVGRKESEKLTNQIKKQENLVGELKNEFGRVKTEIKQNKDELNRFSNGIKDSKKEASGLKKELGSDVADGFGKSIGDAKEKLAGFAENLDPFNSKIGGLIRNMTALQAAIVAVAGALALGAGKLNEFINRELEAIQETTKFAQRLGIATTTLREFELAAGLAGVEAEDAREGIKNLVESVSDAAKDQKGTKFEAFEQLGLNIQALRDLSPEQQLDLVTQALGEIEDSGDRARISMELMGEEGFRLTQISSNTGKTLVGLVEKVRQYGVSLDSVRGQIEEYNELQKASDFINKQVANQGIVETIDATNKLDASWNNLKNTFIDSTIFDTLTGFVDVAKSALAVILDITKWLLALSTLIIEPFRVGAIAVVEFQSRVQQVLRGNLNAFDGFGDVIASAAEDAAGRVEKSFTKALQDVNKQLAKTEEKAKKIPDAVRASNAKGFDFKGVFDDAKDFAEKFLEGAQKKAEELAKQRQKERQVWIDIQKKAGQEQDKLIEKLKEEGKAYKNLLQERRKIIQEGNRIAFNTLVPDITQGSLEDIRLNRGQDLGDSPLTANQRALEQNNKRIEDNVKSQNDLTVSIKNLDKRIAQADTQQILLQ